MSNMGRSNELRVSLEACRAYFLYAALFSAAVNILLPTPIIYMLTVYDRSSGQRKHVYLAYAHAINDRATAFCRRVRMGTKLHINRCK